MNGQALTTPPGTGPSTPLASGPRIQQTLVDAVRLRLAESGAEPTPARVAAALRAEGRVLGDAAVLAVVHALRSDLIGVGPLQPLLGDPRVTDVLVNGPDEVWIDRGSGLERCDVSFPDTEAIRRLAQRLAMAAGRRLDDARPWVDARLPDGTRLHAVLPPVAVGSPFLSLRSVRATAFTLDELVAAGTLGPPGAELLRAVLDARLSFLISGGTGSGKSTLLSSLLGLVGRHERIVLAEDSAELRPDHPHVVRLEARPANQEGAGQITLRELVRQALRMRPDRLVVGEVRGSEVLDLLSAMNTGHAGGCGTVHANAAGDVPARLEALGAVAGLGRAALHSQLAVALSVVVHMERDRSGRRRVAELHVLERTAAGLVVTAPAAVMNASGVVIRQPGWPQLEDRLRRAGAWPTATVRLRRPMSRARPADRPPRHPSAAASRRPVPPGPGHGAANRPRRLPDQRHPAGRTEAGHGEAGESCRGGADAAGLWGAGAAGVAATSAPEYGQADASRSVAGGAPGFVAGGAPGAAAVAPGLAGGSDSPGRAASAVAAAAAQTPPDGDTCGVPGGSRARLAARPGGSGAAR